MLNYNSSSIFNEHIIEHIDKAIINDHKKKPNRSYLGASRLGVSCDRALQYEFFNTPVDDDKQISGKTIRIFAVGHLFEDMIIQWIKKAGFTLEIKKENGEQYGFSTADGFIQGHVDGIITSGPESLDMKYPALWECKSLNDKSWKDTVKRGLNLSKPIYAAQIAIYQAYMESSFPNISVNPAIFTAINKNTCELYFEKIPFNGDLAQRISDKGVKILDACNAKELLPRITNDKSYYACKFCPWENRCWSK